MAQKFFIFIFNFSLLLMGGRFASAGTEMPFPVTPASSLGQKTIEMDLLKLQKQELEEVSAATPDQKPEAISAALQKKNQLLIREMRAFAKRDAPKGVSLELANEILSLTRNHPVVGLQATLKYDTWNQTIGYCFGRAAFVHWELLRRGVKPESIGKIFYVGNLKVDPKYGIFWTYHMATVVRDLGDNWWVIDPLIGEIKNIKEWTKDMKVWAFDPEHPQVRIYFSDAIKMFPIPGAYSPKKLFYPQYRGYFSDLFDWFQKNPVGKVESSDKHMDLNPREGRLEDRIENFSRPDQLLLTMIPVRWNPTAPLGWLRLAPNLKQNLGSKLNLTTTIS